MVSTDYMSDRDVITCIINSQQKQYKVKISSGTDIGVGTVSDKWNRKKSSTKTISTGKVKDKRETNTSTN